MPSVLSYTNAFPGIPFPNHTSGNAKPQNYRYPGAVQPQSTAPTVLAVTAGFPGIQFPNHTSGNANPQNYLWPGAVQPTPAPASTPGSGGSNIIRVRRPGWQW